MLTSMQAARALLAYAPEAAPITWRQLAGAVGAPSASAARAFGQRTHMGRGRWARASAYQYMRGAQPEWPEPLPLVQASLEELMIERRVTSTHAASGSLVIREAQLGDRYRTWNYGLMGESSDGVRKRVTSRTLAPDGHVRVLVAHEGRRLVGSTVIYFVDTLNDEEVDIHEITGPGSVGPVFADASHDWGGHAIVLDSIWVAPDRRRAGVATAMMEKVAEIGLPAWAEFRDPWFAAFVVDRWPPTRPLGYGRYWPLFEAYENAATESDIYLEESVSIDITLWLSDDELDEIEWSAGDSPTELLDSLMTPFDPVRDALESGGWRLDARDSVFAEAKDGWRLTGSVDIAYLAEPLFARAGLVSYLRSPFGESRKITTLEQALDATVIAAVRDKREPNYLRIESWRVVAPQDP